MHPSLNASHTQADWDCPTRRHTRYFHSKQFRHYPRRWSRHSVNLRKRPPTVRLKGPPVRRTLQTRPPRYIGRGYLHGHPENVYVPQPLTACIPLSIREEADLAPQSVRSSRPSAANGLHESEGCSPSVSRGDQQIAKRIRK